MAKKCISCKNELEEGHRFCWRCGQRVFVGVNIPGVEVKQIIFCSYCGREHPDRARFCMECGKELVDEEKRKSAMTQETDEVEFVELTEDIENNNESIVAVPEYGKNENAKIQKVDGIKIEDKDEFSPEEVAKVLSDNNLTLQEKKKFVEKLSEPPHNDSKVIALEYAIGNKDAQIRECAVRGLGKIGSADNTLAKQVINILASATLDKDKFTRIEALKSICTIAEVSRTCSQVTASAVTNALKDVDHGVRYRAIMVINSIFQYAPLFFKDALPLLEKIRDADPMQINKTEAASLLEKLKNTIDEIERAKEETKNIPLEVEPIVTQNIEESKKDVSSQVPSTQQTKPEPPKPTQTGWLRFKPLKKEK